MTTTRKLDDDLHGAPVDQRKYRSMVGSLLGLWYPNDTDAELIGFSDVDHAGFLDTRKSTSGGTQFLGEKLVSCSSNKQDCTALSTAEAEAWSGVASIKRRRRDHSSDGFLLKLLIELYGIEAFGVKREDRFSNKTKKQQEDEEKMDPENDKKQMIEESDRLSSLPDDLIHKILSFNDTKDVIKMSCLSSRWRFIWTTMPCLTFSGGDYTISEHVLCGRDNQRGVTSVRLILCGNDYSLVSQSLKHLTLKADCCYQGRYRWQCGHAVRGWDDDMTGFTLTSKWENLTIRDCKMMKSNIDICHPQLSKLNIEYLHVDVEVFNVVAPQLRNLNIKQFSGAILVSAPDLAHLNIECYISLNLSADDFHSLETVDISISHPIEQEPQELFGLLQRLHSVKFLTLNMEILEILSSSVELLSHQHPPFANLKYLKIYPLELTKKANLAIEVINFILDNSPNATFVMISREVLTSTSSSILLFPMHHTFSLR
ncbi:F-box domain containing protein [Tanacetum coccineum]